MGLKIGPGRHSMHSLHMYYKINEGDPEAGPDGFGMIQIGPNHFRVEFFGLTWV